MGTTAEQSGIDEGGAIDAREGLIATIVEQVRCAGFFLAHLDPQPHQDIIDLRWAAQTAGRLMERQLRTYTSAVGAKVPRKVTVIVALIDLQCPEEAARRAGVQVLVEDILSAPRQGIRHRSVA